MIICPTRMPKRCWQHEPINLINIADTLRKLHECFSSDSLPLSQTPHMYGAGEQRLKNITKFKGIHHMLPSAVSFASGANPFLITTYPPIG